MLFQLEIMKSLRFEKEYIEEVLDVATKKNTQADIISSLKQIVSEVRSSEEIKLK